MKEQDTAGLDIRILPPVEAMRLSLERGSARARTRSRSPATCCATTSPTCSRSWSSAPRPRCCRSCHCCPEVVCSRPAPAARRPSTWSSSSMRATCAGTRWESSWRSALRWSTWRRPTGTRTCRCWPRRWTKPTPRSSNTTARPPARSASLDNRGTHFYLALYWAQALAARDNSSALAARFKKLAETLSADEARINAELIAAQGKPVDTGGLLPARHGQDVGGDAAERDPERGPRRALTPGFLPGLQSNGCGPGRRGTLPRQRSSSLCLVVSVLAISRARWLRTVARLRP